MSTRSNSCSATGTTGQVQLVAEEAHGGQDVRRLEHRRRERAAADPPAWALWLEGRKILASGAGHIERPLVTATDENGRRMIVLPKLGAPIARISRGGRRRACALPRPAPSISPASKSSRSRSSGRDGDYERQPWFSAGAWRFAAVHLGGMERLFDLLRGICRKPIADGSASGRAPGRAAMAAETARLWVARAAATACAPPWLAAAGPARRLRQSCAPRGGGRGARPDAACPAFGRAQAFLRPNPIERISRDLATYLRQPGPDRALMSSAEWILAQPAAAQDLWR